MDLFCWVPLNVLISNTEEEIRTSFRNVKKVQCLRVAHSKEPKRLGLLPLTPPPPGSLYIFFLPEDEIRSKFRNVVIFNILAFVLSNDGKSQETQ
jgi:hypothetical protein